MKLIIIKIFLIQILFLILNGCSDKETISKDSVNFINEGSYIFWTRNSSYCPIDIYVDNVFVGTITTSTSNYEAPDCYTSGYVTIKKPVGIYNYRAENSEYFWNSSFTIAYSCSSVELQ